MSSAGAFSIDQLMELAGLSVSQAGIAPIFIVDRLNKNSDIFQYGVSTH